MKMTIFSILFLVLMLPCSAQVLQWEARYHSTDEVSDLGSAMKVDAQGNVYVSGSSQGSVPLIKYSPNGVLLWSTVYADSGDIIDVVVDVDDAGNVYLAGTLYLTLNSDIVALKYDSTGVLQWARQFDGAEHNYERVLAMETDPSGNMYIFGQTSTTATANDFLLLKYSSGGVEQWARTYNGASSGDDFAGCMTTDNAGNIYTAGTSETTGPNNFTTLKYDASGTMLWSATLDSANGSVGGIAVDSSGNVYVTGSGLKFGTTGDFITVKYSSSGTELWSVGYDGTGHLTDYAVAVTADDSGNAYVTGYSAGFKSNEDFTTIKYDTAGTEVWVARYDSKKKADRPSAIRLDAERNVYITGSSYGSYTNYPDMTTIKYSNAGKREWIARHKALGAGPTKPAVLFVDAQQSVFVFGYSGIGNKREDFLLLKYRQDTSVPWWFQDPGTTKTLFAITAVDEQNAWAVGSAGLIYHTSDGGFVWDKQVTLPRTPDLLAVSFPTSTTGYIGGKKGYLLKTTDAGATWIWLNDAGKSWTTADIERIRFFDENTGYASGKKGAVIKTTDGGLTWESSVATNLASINDIVYTDLRNGRGAGKKGALRSTIDSGATWNALQNGSTNWTTSDLTKITFYDSLNGWACGTKGVLLSTTDAGATWSDRSPRTVAGKVMTGTTYLQAFAMNASTVALTSAKGVITYVSNNNGEHSITCYTGQPADLLDVISIGSTVWAVGKKGAIVKSSTYPFLMAYPEQAHNDFANESPESFTLYENYPNPFNPSTTLSFTTRIPASVTLKVYNGIGQEVATLINKEQLSEGEHSIRFDASTMPSGVYYYSVTVTDLSNGNTSRAVQRMMMIK